MSEELSVCSIINHYENGKLTGFSVAGEEMVSLSEEEALEVPELFPTKKPQPPKAGVEEPLLPPTLEDLFKKRTSDE